MRDYIYTNPHTNDRVKQNPRGHSDQTQSEKVFIQLVR